MATERLEMTFVTAVLYAAIRQHPVREALDGRCVSSMDISRILSSSVVCSIKTPLIDQRLLIG